MSTQVLIFTTTDTGVIGLSPVAVVTNLVTGYLLPAGIGTGITATEPNSGKTYTTVPSATGYFTLNLPNGSYILSFSVKTPAVVPKNLTVYVANNAINLGSINCNDGTTGSVSGKISPVYGAATVRATNVTTGDFVLGTIDYSGGTFNFPALFPGTYKISFTTYVPYLAPTDINAIVKTANVTDAGTATLTYDSNVRVLTYKVNGATTIRYNQTCTFTGSTLSFSLSSITSSGGIPERITTTKSTLILSAANIAGPGRYTLTGANGSNISLNEITSANYSVVKTTTNWGISSAAPLGQLEVTAIDPTARTIRGTFSATLIADQPGVANKSVTDGSFFLNY